MSKGYWPPSIMDLPGVVEERKRIHRLYKDLIGPYWVVPAWSGPVVARQKIKKIPYLRLVK